VGASDVCKCNRLGARSVSELPSRTPIEGERERGEKEQRYRGDRRCRRNRRSLRFLEGDELQSYAIRVCWSWSGNTLLGFSCEETKLLPYAKGVLIIKAKLNMVFSCSLLELNVVKF
jgi:hypothetical protein